MNKVVTDNIAKISARNFFDSKLIKTDFEIHSALSKEIERQSSQIELLAPKNYLSASARQALGSIIAFTTVEGYPGRRYHAGVINLDVIESLAIERAKEMFGCCYANVQPHSGTQANQAVMFALLEPGDSIVSMSLKDGGHLSHGLKTNLSGKWFDVENYGINPETGLIDYDQVSEVCREHRPKLIIVGGSSYPRAIDFARFRTIADEVGAFLLADIAHFSGLVVGGVYPNPFPHCHVVTTTTNKNLRGPHGGLILTNDELLGKRFNSAIFPGIQGGPLPELMSAKAVCFGEALKSEFKDYTSAVLENARTICQVLIDRGYDIVTGGTDSPLLMVDLRSKGLTGEAASLSLEAAGLPCNKNLVPGDTQNSSITSGLRIGTSASTARGLRVVEISIIANLVADILDVLHLSQAEIEEEIKRVRAEVKIIADKNPIYPNETV